jgi:hypothetical protein
LKPFINRFFKSFLYLTIVTAAYCCERNQNDISQDLKTIANDLNSGLNIQFKMTINRNVYIYTNFGEPPQIAIWLENPDSNFYRTVWVTHRSGKNDWKGKIECLVALPYWDQRKVLKKSQNVIAEPDVITGATPKRGELIATITVPEKSHWRYYIEVNASGDYSENFPYWSDLGLPDSEGNGQPSIIYSGLIVAQNGKTSKPKLIGRTDQWSNLSTLYTDIDKITSAKGLVENMIVEVVQ